MEKSHITTGNLLKFLLGSAFGILMFLVPIPQGESFTTLLDFLKSWIKGLFGGRLSYLIMVILIVSAIMSLYDYIAKPDWIRKNHYLCRAFSTTPLYLVSKIVGAIFTVLIVFKIGPEQIISADTGGTMVDLCGTLFSIVIAFSFIMPFLTDCGIMEFLGVLARPVVRLLFHVPGRASVDLIASWFGASNAAVILTREQYMKGYYTKREAGYYLNALGVPEAFAAAPATLVGFTDMFIPALLSVGLVSVKTKFVIGVLSLIQIIYLTEVGTIIIKSEIPLNFWKLLVIFLERTIIAIPLIVLFANMIGL
ncbi:YjiH family protein [Blautia sp. AM29-29]|uniref:YjiH family protein n=1 Tax=Blautia sp. AM29-29 TaxID=2292975 RepID=UPI001FAA9E63|nr:nucleoside recognition domain-containing protein [Blautia sp. AM29-29]